jgi:hypothetical protein
MLPRMPLVTIIETLYRATYLALVMHRQRMIKSKEINE